MIGNQAQGRCVIFLIICIFYVLNNYGINAQDEYDVVVGKNFTLKCITKTDSGLWWSKNGQNITKNDKRFLSSIKLIDLDENGLLDDEITQNHQQQAQLYTNFLDIINIKLDDTGNYTCHHFVADNNEINVKSFYIQAVIPATIVAHSSAFIKAGISKAIGLYCVIEAYPLERYKNAIQWQKEDDGKDYSNTRMNNLQISNKTVTQIINATQINVTLDFEDLMKKDNGTYTCAITAQPIGVKNRVQTSIFVLDVPQVSIDYVKAVGASKIFMNWTLNDGNDPVTQYFIQFMKNNTPTYSYYSDRINGGNTSYVLDGFEANTSYLFKLAAKNKIGNGPQYTYPLWVTTLERDPNFIPVIRVTGNTFSTITIGWAPPPNDLLEYIHYFELIVSEASENSSVKEEAIHPQNSRNLPYMFDDLKSATEYLFKVRACNELTKICGNWSDVVNGTTMDGISSEPLNVRISCSHFNISGRSTVTVTWDPPAHRNGIILNYHLSLTGLATFKNENGIYQNTTYGPKTKSVDERSMKAIYEGVPPNTNYTVKVSAVTRTKKIGESATATCTMPHTVPHMVGRSTWDKYKTEAGNWVFKLHLQRVTERNGPICCYRIYLMRLGDKNNLERIELPPPSDLDILTYHEVHAANNTKLGAYVAEVFSSDHFYKDVFLGDGQRMKNLDNNTNDDSDSKCRKCLKGMLWKRPIRKRITTTTALPIVEISENIPDLPPSKIIPDDNKNNSILSKRRRRRQHDDNKSTVTDDIMSPSPTTITIGSNNFEVFDGELDMSSKYTGFVEVIVDNGDSDILSEYSPYFDEMAAGAPIISGNTSDDISAILNIVVQVLCALVLLVLVLLLALCFVHRYYSKHAAQGDEIISLRDSLRVLCGGRSNHNHHRHLVGSASSKPPDIAPITKTDLPHAYIARHKDSDYGFQHEFEMLPDRFNDRTTKNSDAKENIYKNRYPDIKAYDQTRVKLSMINSTIGSDYINANFILGYKERKKFICAQGPMDSTVNDFWRMIWEQHLEIIVMLTNLEEYNKTKCAKYWPEKVTDSTQFGDINVTFVTEQRVSDYLIRELRIAKRSSNGDDEENEKRYITQYHYLVWKDFMAPEYPHGIIKFIKQINSVYSLQRGPILVHCSAGVGRTGTLVALDSLTQQLEEEGHVDIFNTIYDMRHQRNFLVQSLKQYIFLYRALMEIAQFGDTEIPFKGIGGVIENLKTKSNDSKEQCKLELQYDKLKSINEDLKKTCAVGSGDENRIKNRSDMIIPYDRNRVILTPIPGREHSTYINASFIEGYDNSESFIITQDPMENTIADFWRMISEQGITTLIMLSEIGDGNKKCPRYWADDEIQYDHILVKYIQSETCPYYTKREFNVTNCKIDDMIQVIQFQYHGWPTVEGEVPEVTRGMIELIDSTQKLHNSQANYSAIGRSPITVHCNMGSDRSSIFVAMCILVQQLRIEKKIDICTTTRKLRSQRSALIDTYAQYEFLHRAIVNYADLHRLSLESPTTDCS